MFERFTEKAPIARELTTLVPEDVSGWKLSLNIWVAALLKRPKTSQPPSAIQK
jgi:hypothetical protein